VKFKFLELKIKKVVLVHTMTACRGSRRIYPLLLILGTNGAAWLTSRLDRCTPGKKLQYPKKGGWVGP
jgi:hypothetical protein